ncbi:hypothetical protein EVAR_64909_1 [Eumeta japonica]|uniref:Uncharacterized protein n=1 Tax=Eumeta variegata TaxID=151549 RepID=A0A4C2ADJ7_EUMVA|nr:hypothetical protein EVAR_64909_1 [Eumeta japonica]
MSPERRRPRNPRAVDVRVAREDPSYSFDFDPVPTLVFDFSLVLSFGYGPVYNSDLGLVLDSTLGLAFNSVSVINHNSDFNETGELADSLALCRLYTRRTYRLRFIKILTFVRGFACVMVERFIIYAYWLSVTTMFKSGLSSTTIPVQNCEQDPDQGKSIGTRIEIKTETRTGIERRDNIALVVDSVIGLY